MLTFTKIDEVVLDVLGRTQPRELFSKYSGKGGQDAVSTWHTSGFYCEDADGIRTVLESLYVINSNTCVIRVFCESPAQILYSTKVSDIDNFAHAFSLASDVLVKNMPINAVMPEMNDPEHLEFLASISPDIADSLGPIPPPLRLQDIPDYHKA